MVHVVFISIISYFRSTITKVNVLRRKQAGKIRVLNKKLKYYKPKRAQERLKRKQAIIDRLREVYVHPAIDNNRAVVRKLRAQNKKKENAMETLRGDLKTAIERTVELNREAAQNQLFYDNRIAELNELLRTVDEKKPTKSNKVYLESVQMWTYTLLDAGTATNKIPQLLKKVFPEQDVPQRSSIERMCIELGLLSDMQVSEVLYTQPELTIGFDASTQEGMHFNVAHISSEAAMFTVALDELAGNEIVKKNFFSTTSNLLLSITVIIMINISFDSNLLIYIYIYIVNRGDSSGLC